MAKPHPQHGLWFDRIEVEPGSAAVRHGLEPAEALLTSRLEGLEIESYASARRAGVGLHQAIDLHRRGIELGVYGAVKHYGGLDDLALDASEARVCGLGYRICCEVGLAHDRVLELHSADVNLWAATLDHRRTRGIPDDDFDTFLERLAIRGAGRSRS